MNRLQHNALVNLKSQRRAEFVRRAFGGTLRRPTVGHLAAISKLAEGAAAKTAC
jgi:hypothetical protein